jgi:hypothetical protein
MMTKKNIFKFYILIQIVFVSQLVDAQHHFQDGFVITTKNDTLVGKLNNLHKHSHIYIDFLYSNGVDTVFTPNHISSYEIGNQRFEVVPIPQIRNNDTSYLFAQVLIEGYANLYKTKIKVDPITAAEDAYLCRKYDEKKYFPAGNLGLLTTFFSDYTSLQNELANHIHLYTNDMQTKMQLFNHYNSWKRKMLDSLSNIRPLDANIKVEKQLTEIFIDKNHDLTPETKYHLDELTNRLVTDPGLEMVFEFVNNVSETTLINKTINSVKMHLNEFDARIQEVIITIPDNQDIKPSKPNGQILYYYYK